MHYTDPQSHSVRGDCAFLDSLLPALYLRRRTGVRPAVNFSIQCFEEYSNVVQLLLWWSLISTVRRIQPQSQVLAFDFFSDLSTREPSFLTYRHHITVPMSIFCNLFLSSRNSAPQIFSQCILRYSSVILGTNFSASSAAASNTS